MPVEGIGGASQAPAATPGAQESKTSLGLMDSEAFLKLFVAQMRYQNPMAPSDHSSMMAQTAQFTQVETLQKLAQSQKELLSFQQTAVATGLIGKEVTALGENAEPFSGIVQSLRFDEKGLILRIGEHEVPLSQALEVRIPASEPPTTTA